MIVVGSRSHANPALAGHLEKLGRHELVSMGSSLKFCLVAEGKADLYPRLGLTSEWDTAAAQCIVEQAGGRVLELDGRPLSYNQKEDILNPWFIVVGAAGTIVGCSACRRLTEAMATLSGGICCLPAPLTRSSHHPACSPGKDAPVTSTTKVRTSALATSMPKSALT